jgi:hypothetical protein
MWVAVIGESLAGLGGDRYDLALIVRPAIIGCWLDTHFADVDLFPGILANVVDVNPLRARLEGEGVGVSQAAGPDGAVLSGRHVVVGVARGDGAVGIEPQYLAQSAGERLCLVLESIVPVRDVELPVGPEVNGPAVVVCGRRQRR